MRALHRHVAVAVLLSVVCRLRFVSAPLGDDEGVLLTAARSWSRGGAAYRDVWVDRPQGALVLARAWLTVASPSSWRWVAVVAGALLVVAVAGVARSAAMGLASTRPDLVPHPDRVAAVAALVTAVWSSSPALLGAAAGPALVGVAFSIAAWWWSAASFGRAGGAAALAAGLCCGVAVSLDLSAAVAASLVPLWLALASIRRRRRAAASATLRLVGVGAAAIVAPLAVHASTVGMSTWWASVVTARLRHDDPQQWLTAVAIAASAVGLVVGGLQRAWWRAALVTVVLAPAAWLFGTQVFRPDAQVSTGSSGAGAMHAEVVGRWLSANTSPDERVLALCSGAAVYAHADRAPAVPYLTADEFRRAGASSMLLVSALSGADRPTVVVVFDLPAGCGSPSLVAVLGDHYVDVASVDGVRVLRRKGA